jgi:uncharacterized membrane protein YebE (DUF533 family)
VAWGLYETLSQQGSTPVSAGGAGPAPSGATEGPAKAGPHISADAVPSEVLRVIRLTIAAARADGVLTPREEETILAKARTVGAEALVKEELQHPTPLPTIVAGARPEQHRDMYTLAFAVTRADETVSGGERIFLAQLAHQLGLDAAMVAELEASAVARISEGA